MALIVGRAAPRIGMVMVWVAAGMGLGRVRTGLHYPSDLVAGALLGGAVGLLVREAKAVPPKLKAAHSIVQSMK
jgi:membrane-associated phospholipid phosphatase